MPTIELTPGRSSGEIKGLVRYTSARHAGAPIPDDLAGVRAVDHRSLQFGTVGDTVFVFMKLRNTGALPGTWILTTGRSTISEFTLYRHVGGTWRAVLEGADRATLARALDRYQAYAGEVQLEPGEEALYAIRFRDEVSSWMPLEIETYGDFFTARRSNIVLVTAVVAGSLILALFNVVLLAGTGQRVFVWLGLAEAAFAFNTLHAEGYLSIFWLHAHPGLQAVFGEFTRTVFGLLMLQFAREFLDTRRRMPRFDLFLRGLAGLGFAVVAASLVQWATAVFPVMILHAAGWLFTVLAAAVLPVIGWIATRRFGRQYFPLLVGWSALGLYIGTTALAISGLFPRLAVNWHWVGPIGLFECAMATLAVGLHLRKLHQERLAAEEAARAALLERIAITEEASRLAEERAQALASLQARDRLIEMSAHDTRHVLHALSSAVHLGRQTEGELPRRDLMTLIEASARHLEEIVGSSVTIDNGDGRFLALGRVRIGRLIDDIVTIYDAAAHDSDVAIERNCDGAVTAIVDEALLARVLSNLVNNALRATRSGRIAIDCAELEDCITLTVRDTGPGMPPAIAAWLTEGGDEDCPEGPPAGLGKGWRAIRDIVALLHGSYSVDSSDRGTSVTITLPRIAEAPGDDAVELIELAAENAAVRFIDEESASDSEIEKHLARLRPHELPIFVASKASAEARVRAAALGHLMFLRPLSRSLMGHPYVVELITSRAARARSTS